MLKTSSLVDGFAWPISPILLHVEILGLYWGAGWLFETARLRQTNSFASVFFHVFFIKRISAKIRPNTVWRQIWQDVGPDWEGFVRKFERNPSRRFCRVTEKLRLYTRQTRCLVLVWGFSLEPIFIRYWPSGTLNLREARSGQYRSGKIGTVGNLNT